MSRRIYEQMLEDLELTNYTRACLYPRWNAMQNPVYHSMVDKDFRTSRANRGDFYTTTDYFRQPYYMYSNFLLPGYEPLYLTNPLRRVDKRNLHCKTHQPFAKERRSYGEKRFYQNRQEREDSSYKGDRGRRNDYMAHFERRYQSSNYDRDVSAHNYHLSRDTGNSSRLSFRGSSIDFCAEDVMDQHFKHQQRQAFDSRNSSSEYIALKENVLRTEAVVPSESSVIEYSDASGMEWKETASKISNPHSSENVAYNLQHDFNNSYESWYCPQEQQQIVDTLKEVNLRHDRQLRRDILAYRVEQLYSDVSVSSNLDYHALDHTQNSPSSEDEEVINIMLSPRPTSPNLEATGEEEEELKSGYLEKSASDFFEEFQNIFTGSPERQIFNNLINKSLKKTSYIDDEDLEVSGAVITKEDKEAVKSVLIFNDTDDESVISSVTSSSPKGISSGVSNRQSTLCEPETECSASCKNLNSDPENKLIERDAPKENSKIITTKRERLKSTSNWSENSINNILKTKEPVAGVKMYKPRIVSKGTTEISSSKYPHDFTERKKMKLFVKNILKNSDFKENRKLKCSQRQDKEFPMDSSSKILDNLEHLQQNISDQDNKKEHELQFLNKCNSSETNQFYFRNNGSLNVSTETHPKALQNSTCYNQKNRYNIYNQDHHKTFCCDSTNDISQTNNFAKSEDSTPSFSEPLLPSRENETVYRRISVSEIFKSSISKSENNTDTFKDNENPVQKFMNHSHNQKPLSPSAHLKLILGIADESTSLNKNKVVQQNIGSEDANLPVKLRKTYSSSKTFKQSHLTHKNSFPTQEAVNSTPCCKAADDREMKLKDRLPQSLTKFNSETCKSPKQKGSVLKSKNCEERAILDSVVKINDRTSEVQSKVSANKISSKHNNYSKHSNNDSYSKSGKQVTSTFTSTLHQETTQLSITKNRTKENYDERHEPKASSSIVDFEKTENINRLSRSDNAHKKDSDRDNYVKHTKKAKFPSEKLYNTLELNSAINEEKPFEELCNDLKLCLDNTNSSKKYKKKKKKEKNLEKSNNEKNGTKTIVHKSTEGKKITKEIANKKENSFSFDIKDSKFHSQNSKDERFNTKSENCSSTVKSSINDKIEAVSTGKNHKETLNDAKSNNYKSKQEKAFETHCNITKENSVQNKYKNFGKDRKVFDSSLETIKTKCSSLSSGNYEHGDFGKKHFVKTKYSKSKYPDSKGFFVSDVQQKISSTEMHCDDVKYTGAEGHMSKSKSNNGSHNFKKCDIYEKSFSCSFIHKEKLNFSKEHASDEIFESSNSCVLKEDKSEASVKIESSETSADKLKRTNIENQVSLVYLKDYTPVSNFNSIKGHITNDRSKKSLHELQKNDTYETNTGSSFKCIDKSNHAKECPKNKKEECPNIKMATKSVKNDNILNIADRKEILEIDHIPEISVLGVQPIFSLHDISYSKILMNVIGRPVCENGAYDLKNGNFSERIGACNIKSKLKEKRANERSYQASENRMKNLMATAKVLNHNETCNKTESSKVLVKIENSKDSEKKNNVEASDVEFCLPIITTHITGNTHSNNSIAVTKRQNDKIFYKGNKKYERNAGFNAKYKNKSNVYREWENKDNDITLICKIDNIFLVDQMYTYKAFNEEIQNFNVHMKRNYLTVRNCNSRQESYATISKTNKNIWKIYQSIKSEISNDIILTWSSDEDSERLLTYLVILKNMLTVINTMEDLKDRVQNVFENAACNEEFLESPKFCLSDSKYYLFNFDRKYDKIDSIVLLPYSKNVLMPSYFTNWNFALCICYFDGNKSKLISSLLDSPIRDVALRRPNKFLDYAKRMFQRYSEISVMIYAITDIIKIFDLSQGSRTSITKFRDGVICIYCIGILIIIVPSSISTNYIYHRAAFNPVGLNPLTKFNPQVLLHDVFSQIEPGQFFSVVQKLSEFDFSNLISIDSFEAHPIFLCTRSILLTSTLRTSWDIKNLEDILYSYFKDEKNIAYQEKFQQCFKKLLQYYKTSRQFLFLHR